MDARVPVFASCNAKDGPPSDGRAASSSLSPYALVSFDVPSSVVGQRRAGNSWQSCYQTWNLVQVVPEDLTKLHGPWRAKVMRPFASAGGLLRRQQALQLEVEERTQEGRHRPVGDARDAPKSFAAKLTPGTASASASSATANASFYRSFSDTSVTSDPMNLFCKAVRSTSERLLNPHRGVPAAKVAVNIESEKQSLADAHGNSASTTTLPNSTANPSRGPSSAYNATIGVNNDPGAAGGRHTSQDVQEQQQERQHAAGRMAAAEVDGGDPLVALAPPDLAIFVQDENAAYLPAPGSAGSSETLRNAVATLAEARWHATHNDVLSIPVEAQLDSTGELSTNSTFDAKQPNRLPRLSVSSPLDAGVSHELVNLAGNVIPLLGDGIEAQPPAAARSAAREMMVIVEERHMLALGVPVVEEEVELQPLLHRRATSLVRRTSMAHGKGSRRSQAGGRDRRGSSIGQFRSIAASGLGTSNSKALSSASTLINSLKDPREQPVALQQQLSSRSRVRSPVPPPGTQAVAGARERLSHVSLVDSERTTRSHRAPTLRSESSPTPPAQQLPAERRLAVFLDERLLSLLLPALAATRARQWHSRRERELEHDEVNGAAGELKVQRYSSHNHPPHMIASMFDPVSAPAVPVDGSLRTYEANAELCAGADLSHNPASPLLPVPSPLRSLQITFLQRDVTTRLMTSLGDAIASQWQDLHAFHLELLAASHLVPVSETQCEHTVEMIPSLHAHTSSPTDGNPGSSTSTAPWIPSPRFMAAASNSVYSDEVRRSETTHSQPWSAAGDRGYAAVGGALFGLYLPPAATTLQQQLPSSCTTSQNEKDMGNASTSFRGYSESLRSWELQPVFVGADTDSIDHVISALCFRLDHRPTSYSLLTSIALVRLGLDDRRVAPLLRFAAALSRLDLSWNYLGDESCRLLWDALLGDDLGAMPHSDLAVDGPTLESLSLCGNSISDSGAGLLMQVMRFEPRRNHHNAQQQPRRNCLSLRFVDLAQNRISMAVSCSQLRALEVPPNPPHWSIACHRKAQRSVRIQVAIVLRWCVQLFRDRSAAENYRVLLIAICEFLSVYIRPFPLKLVC